jgi:hypothetical protein
MPPLGVCFVEEDQEGFSFERQFLSPLVRVAAGRNAGITKALLLLFP